MQLYAGRKPCPNDKIVKNVLALSCADGAFTPLAAAHANSLRLPPEEVRSREYPEYPECQRHQRTPHV